MILAGFLMETPIFLCVYKWRYQLISFFPPHKLLQGSGSQNKVRDHQGPEKHPWVGHADFITCNVKRSVLSVKAELQSSFYVHLK